MREMDGSCYQAFTVRPARTKKPTAPEVVSTVEDRRAEILDNLQGELGGELFGKCLAGDRHPILDGHRLLGSFEEVRRVFADSRQSPIERQLALSITIMGLLIHETIGEAEEWMTGESEHMYRVKVLKAAMTISRTDPIAKQRGPRL